MSDSPVDNKEEEKHDFQFFKPVDHHYFGLKSTLETLERVENRIEQLENKLCNLEKKLEENISGKVLTENRFLQEIQSTDELVDKIVAKFNSLSSTSAAQEISGKINDGSFGRGEAEKVGLITDLLQTNKRLSSIQLAKLINISRTRANEYLRMMEKLGIVKGFLIGKEKHYQLKHSFVSLQ